MVVLGAHDEEDTGDRLMLLLFAVTFVGTETAATAAAAFSAEWYMATIAGVLVVEDEVVDGGAVGVE